MTDDSVRRYFEFYRAHLNGENKTRKGSLVPICNDTCMSLFYWLLNIFFNIQHVKKNNANKFEIYTFQRFRT
jgi:hypothetical protein